MSERLRFEANGKIVNLLGVLGQAKPFHAWTTGELRVLDRLGFVVIGRDLTRDQLTYDDLFALITYFAMKANRSLSPADVDTLTMEQFGAVAAAFVEQFGPRIFPKKAEAEGAPVPKAPSPDGADTPSTPSDAPAAGAPVTSTP